MTSSFKVGTWESPPIKITQALLVGIIFLAAFTRIWRLGDPHGCYFDEVYFPTTGAEILQGRDDAWDFYGHENTHPPLSKDLMAIGEAIFGRYDLKGGENNCWGDEADKAKKTSNSWAYEPFGYRFPGALAGVFSVIFMYLLARKLLNSEIGALASAFLLSIDGLVLAQSRIATPDTFVLCFVLGSMYFMATKRWLWAGVFLGAAASTKWNGAFLLLPIVMFFAAQVWDQRRRLVPEPRLREAERVLAVGLAAIALGVVLFGAAGVAKGGVYPIVLLVGGVPAVLGVFVIVGGIIAILTDSKLFASDRGRMYVRVAAAFPLFFILLPALIYVASYTPMFFNGGGLNHMIDLNRAAYEFHSSLRSHHGYQSQFWSWPIDERPVYFYLGPGQERIYNLGNPIIFWMSIPALFYTLWQGLLWVRVRVEEGSRVRFFGRIHEEQLVPFFIIITYLGFWLALVTQGRALFLYHYQQAFAMAVLALGFTTARLWDHPHPWSRNIVIGFLAVCFVTFVYFYPHWTAIDVPGWLDNSYFWFPTWR
jgi:dolichyl-phosphate-mannose--protein O-mannosyl transferase